MALGGAGPVILSHEHFPTIEGEAGIGLLATTDTVEFRKQAIHVPVGAVCP